MTDWTVPCRGRLTSGYGPRVAPTPGASTFHRGVDLAPPVKGQRAPVDVHSVGPGKVLAVGRDAERGVWVVVAHDDGSATTYQHLAARLVGAGMRVDAGATLGVMGQTGTSAGVHLHLEAFADVDDWVQRGTSWRSAAAEDPELYLARRGVHLRAAIAVSDPVVVIPAAPRPPAVPAPALGPLPTPIAPEEDDMAVIDESERMLQRGYRTECRREAADWELYPRLRRIIAAPDWRKALDAELTTIDGSTESNRADINALYRDLLGRDGEVASIDNWAATTGHPINDGRPMTQAELDAIAAGIRQSPEYQARAGR